MKRDRTSPIVFLMLGVAALLVIVATTRLFAGDLDDVGRYGYAAVGVTGLALAIRTSGRVDRLEARVRELEKAAMTDLPTCSCGHSAVTHGMTGLCQRCECNDYMEGRR